MWEYHDPYHPAADELYHFKYIKRVQGPNGKWQYYYDRDALRGDAKSAATKVRRAAANVRAHANTAGWYAKKGLNDAARRAYPKVMKAKEAVKSGASYAKGAYRNTRNNAIRKGVDAKRTLSNKLSALSYRMKNRGLAERQAEAAAIDDQIARNASWRARAKAKETNAAYNGMRSRMKKERMATRKARANALATANAARTKTIASVRSGMAYDRTQKRAQRRKYSGR